MLAIVSGPRNRLTYADFGEPLGLPEDPRALLRWVLEDYPRRRDEQWQVAPPAGSPVVRELLDEATEPAIVAAALLALGWYGLPESGPQLMRFIDRPDLLVRRAAVRALGQIGWMPAFAHLDRKLDDPDPELRREAAIAVAKYGRKEALGRVIGATAAQPDGAELAEHARRRTRAVAALAKDDLRSYVEIVIDSPAFEDLCAWMPFIWAQLSQMPPDPDHSLEVRVRAARLLGLGRARRSARLLLGTLTNARTPLALRIECAKALGRLGQPGLLDPLVPLLEAEELELQLAVIGAVGATKSPRALMPLLGLWDAREKSVREPVRLAVRALAEHPAQHALLSGWTRPPEGELVATVLEGDRWTTTECAAWVRPRLVVPEAASRQDAAAVLGIAGEPGDVAVLARLAVQDPDEEVRWVAAVAARSLAGGDLNP